MCIKMKKERPKESKVREPTNGPILEVLTIEKIKHPHKKKIWVNK